VTKRCTIHSTVVIAEMRLLIGGKEYVTLGDGPTRIPEDTEVRIVEGPLLVTDGYGEVIEVVRIKLLDCEAWGQSVWIPYSFIYER
jgi:hypothetical protein